MIDPFQPLLRLVTIAVSPQGLAFVVTPGAGGSAPSQTSSSRQGPVPVDRHSLAPVVLASDHVADWDTPPYSLLGRHQLLFQDKEGTNWVSLNSVTVDVSPPPHRRRGPIGCGCQPRRGYPGSRYGPAQSDLALWCADLYEDTRPSAPFIPDLFAGQGPCNARTHRGDLAQWDDEWVVDDELGVHVDEEQLKQFDFHDLVDETVRQALCMRFGYGGPKAPRVASDAFELKRLYGFWVAHKQEFRGHAIERLVRDGYWRKFKEERPDIWDDLLLVGYFAYLPVGVWVPDTPVLAHKIKELQAYGVPVYYRWEDSFNHDSRLTELKPWFAFSATAVSSRLRPRTPPGLPPTASVSSEETSARRTPSGKAVHFEDDEFWTAANDEVDCLETERRAAATAKLRDAPLSPRRDTSWFTGHRSSTPETSRARIANPALYASAVPASNVAPTAPASPLLKPALDPDPASKTTFLWPKAKAAKSASAATRTVNDAPLYTIIPPPLSQRLDGSKPDRERARARVAEALSRDPDGETTSATVAYRVRSVSPERPPTSSLATRLGLTPKSSKPRLFVKHSDTAESRLEAFLTSKGSDVNIVDVLKFLLANRMPFMSAVPVPGAEDVSIVSADVGVDEWFINASGAPSDCFSQWVSNARALIRGRPRVGRAVWARGGLVARIVQYLGHAQDFDRYPTPYVCTSGSPNFVEEAGIRYYDDWLYTEELAVIVGATGVGNEGVKSIFPPVELFDTFYAGTWTMGYERWFLARVGDLEGVMRAGSKAKVLRSRHDWRSSLKGCSFAKA